MFWKWYDITNWSKQVLFGQQISLAAEAATGGVLIAASVLQVY